MRFSTSSWARMTAPATTARWLSTFRMRVARREPPLAAAMRTSSLSKSARIVVVVTVAFTGIMVPAVAGQRRNGSVLRVVSCVSMDPREVGVGGAFEQKCNIVVDEGQKLSVRLCCLRKGGVY